MWAWADPDVGSSPSSALNSLGGLNLPSSLGIVSSQGSEKGIVLIKCLAQGLATRSGSHIRDFISKHKNTSLKPGAGPGGGKFKVGWARALPVGSGESPPPQDSQCP